MQTITNTFSKVQLGDAKIFNNLAMFPLFADAEGEPGYLTLEEALGANLATVSETSEGGTVPQLKFENRASKPILLLDGEQLVGAKQNRVLNLTILAPAGATITIPVSCVEAGRWRYDSPTFNASNQVHFARGRANKAADVSVSLRNNRGRYSNQSRVWDDINVKMNRLQCESNSAAMDDIYQQREAMLRDYDGLGEPVEPAPGARVMPTGEELQENFGAARGQVGAVFAIGGRITGVELFDHPATLARVLPKLVRSYAIDALEEQGEEVTTAEQAQARVFLDSVATAPVESYDALGEGHDLRLHAEGLAGGALEAGERLVHLCAFCISGNSEDGHTHIATRARNLRIDQ